KLSHKSRAITLELIPTPLAHDSAGGDDAEIARNTHGLLNIMGYKVTCQPQRIVEHADQLNHHAHGSGVLPGTGVIVRGHHRLEYDSAGQCPPPGHSARQLAGHQASSTP